MIQEFFSLNRFTEVEKETIDESKETFVKGSSHVIF